MSTHTGISVLRNIQQETHAFITFDSVKQVRNWYRCRLAGSVLSLLGVEPMHLLGQGFLQFEKPLPSTRTALTILEAPMSLP